MKIGLKIDVDTFTGTRKGVPNLMRILDRHGLRGAFFFSVGPDNMGRHLFRLFKPRFLWKMLRTQAASLYGPEIIFRGTFGPGPKIGKGNERTIRDCDKAGHEIGLHGWDHHYWQAHSDRMSEAALRRHFRLGYDELARIIGRGCDCCAVPAWKCTESALVIKEEFPFRYGSDCRGRGIFIPVVHGHRLKTPQIAMNLPTYDELIGAWGVTDENYNETLLSRLDPTGPNLLTIHAEVEGMSRSGLFEDFLARAKSLGLSFVLPSELIPQNRAEIPEGSIEQGNIPGREGTLAVYRPENVSPE